MSYHILNNLNKFVGKLKLKWLAFFSLGLIFLASLCIIVVSLVSGSDRTSTVISIIGSVGLLNWIIIGVFSFARRSQFDRDMAQASFMRLAYILFLVMSVPCILYFCCNTTTFNINKEWTDFNTKWINPFLNHDNFGSIIQSLVSILGIFFLSGVFVSMLVSFINLRAKRWEKGELYYKFRVTDYCVVIGGHDAVPSLASQLVKKYSRVIVFTNRDIPSFRREVESSLETEEEKRGLVFYYGNRDSLFDLKHLHVERKNLRSVYVLGESRVHGEEEASHDTLNMTCYDFIAELRGKNKPLIDCFVFFEHQTTSIIFQKYATEHQSESLHFIPHNFYELLAQKAIGWGGCLNHSPVRLDRFGYKKEDCESHNVDKHVHLVIVGMSRMGLALGLEAIRVCHYPNYAQSQLLYEYDLDTNAVELMEKRRTKITFIDCNMKDEFDSFNCQYRSLMNNISWRYIDFIDYSNSKCHHITLNKERVAADIEIEFINGTLQSNHVIHYIKSIVDDKNAVLTIASCLPESNRSVAVVSCFPKYVLENAVIMVYQPDSVKLVENIIIGQNEIKAFGKLSDSVNLTHLNQLEMMSTRIHCVYQKSRDKVKYNSLADYTIRAMDDYDKTRLDHSRCSGCTLLDDETCKKKCKNYYWCIDETTRWANRYHASAIWQKWPYVVSCKEEELKEQIGSGLSWEQKGISIDKQCEGLMARTEHNRWCIEQWILDRPIKDKRAFYSYYQLELTKAPLYVFPTNDQVMTMAIPYIIGGSPLNDEHKSSIENNHDMQFLFYGVRW